MARRSFHFLFSESRSGGYDGLGLSLIYALGGLLFGLLLIGCTAKSKSNEDNYFQNFGIFDEEKEESISSIRALNRAYNQGSEWYIEFEFSDLKGDLGYEEGVVRRDPSDVIKVDGIMYVYYTKSTGMTYGFGTSNPENKVFPWDKSDVYYASSKDGLTWVEEGVAVARGKKGDFDDRSVFTPQITRVEDKFVLLYQAVKAPYLNRVKNVVAMAISDSPKGPFIKQPEPILFPSENGEWFGEEDNRFKAKKKGSFDSHKVHDPTLIQYDNKFYLYYKGEQIGERLTMGGREVKWGVAISSKLEGPYIKSIYNPVTNSGNQVCVWKYDKGIAAMLSTNGPERNTLQWAPDGINFEIQSYIRHAPESVGLFQFCDFEESQVQALHVGLTHNVDDNNTQYIRRFKKTRPLVP
ncbi:MAG: glycosyl hydrolase [Reichenbachiella sp.]